MPFNLILMLGDPSRGWTFHGRWYTRLLYVCIIMLVAEHQVCCMTSNCSWTTGALDRRPILNNCFVRYHGSDTDIGAFENAPSDPASWIPVSIRPPGLWPQPAAFRGLTLTLPSCAPVWLLSETACTFRLSATWPIAGLQAGRAFILFGRLVTSSIEFERLNITCPEEDWDSLLLPTSSSSSTSSSGGAGGPAAGSSDDVRLLAPCGTATVSTGEQLVDALQQLQLTNARVILTLAANITIPVEPTPQRVEDTADDREPVVHIYRNVTLTGMSDYTAPFNDDGTHAGAATELNLRFRRNLFGMAAAASPDMRPPVLVFADLHLANAPPGPPSTWPLGLLTFAQHYVGLNRSQAAGVQIIALRSVKVLTAGEAGYVSFWRTRSISLSADVRKASAWLTSIASFPALITNEDGSGSSSCMTVSTILFSCNSTMNAETVLTPITTEDFGLWSLEPAIDGSIQEPLPPGSFATAANASQLLNLLQEAWCCGPRVILVIANITLRPGEWPQVGGVLSYNASLVGPVAGDPVWLDTGGLPLVREPAGTDLANHTNQTSFQQQPQTPIVLQLHRLRIAGFRPPLLRAVGRAVKAAEESGAFGDQLPLVAWKDRCLEESPIPTGSATAAVVRYDLRSCLLELPPGALQLLLLYNSPNACVTYTIRAGGGSNSSGAAAATTAASDSTIADVSSNDGNAAMALCDILLASSANVTATDKGPLEAPLLRPLLSSVLKMDPPAVSLVPVAQSVPPGAGGVPSMSNISTPRLWPVNTTLSGAAVSLSRCAFAAAVGVGDGNSSGSSNSSDDAGAACSIDTFLLALHSSMTNYNNDSAAVTRDDPRTASPPGKVPVAVVIGSVLGGVCILAVMLALTVYAAVVCRRTRQSKMGGMLPASCSFESRTQCTSKGRCGKNGDTAELGYCCETSTNDQAAVAMGTERGTGGLGGASSNDDGAFSLSFVRQQERVAAAEVALVIAQGGVRNPNIWQQHETMADALIGDTAEPDIAKNNGRAPAHSHHHARAMEALRPMMAGSPRAVQQHGPAAGRDVSVHPQAASSSQGTMIHDLQTCVSDEIQGMLRKYKKAVALGSGSGGAKASQGGNSGTGKQRLRLLGRGAFGAVYLGSWRGLPAAIKVIILNAADSGERRERLIREAALTAALSHPNVVPTYDYEIQPMLALLGSALNETYSGDEGVTRPELVTALQLHLIMQYCEGGTLAAALRDGKFGLPPDGMPPVHQQLQKAEVGSSNSATGGQPAADVPEQKVKARLDWADIAPAANLPLALLAALDVLRGLEYLHGHKVVHGDLTENNVLLKAVTPVLPPERQPLQHPQYYMQQPNEQQQQQLRPGCSKEAALGADDASQQDAAAQPQVAASASAQERELEATKPDLDLTFVSSGWEAGEQEEGAGAARTANSPEPSPSDGANPPGGGSNASAAVDSHSLTMFLTPMAAEMCRRPEDPLPKPEDGAGASDAAEDLPPEPGARQLRDPCLVGWPSAHQKAGGQQHQGTSCLAQTGSSLPFGMAGPESQQKMLHGSEYLHVCRHRQLQEAADDDGALPTFEAAEAPRPRPNQAAAQLQQEVMVSEAAATAADVNAREPEQGSEDLSNALLVDDPHRSSSAAPSSTLCSNNREESGQVAAIMQQQQQRDQKQQLSRNWAAAQAATTSSGSCGQHRPCSSSSTAAASAARGSQGVVSQLLKWSFKISDFGLSVQLHGGSHSHMSNMAQGTPFFAAPEVVHRGHLSTAADIYSFGVLLWLLLHGVSLMQLRHLLPRIPQVPINSLLLRNCSALLPPEAHKVLRSCLAGEPGGRPLVGDVIVLVEDILRAVAGPELSRLLLCAERTEYWVTSSSPATGASP